jgi:hypothetical protein
MSYEDAKNYAEPQQTKFESYSTPGGIPGSYREVVTTLPARDLAAVNARLDEAASSVYDHAVARGASDAEANAFLAELGAAVEDGRAPRIPPKLDTAEMRRLVEPATSATQSLPYESSHWPGITNPLLHYRQKDFLNHADPTSVGSLEKVTQPFDTSRTWYHGTNRAFDEFSFDNIGHGISDGHLADPVPSVWFTSNPDIASGFAADGQGAQYMPPGANVRPAHLQPDNMAVVDMRGADSMSDRNLVNQHLRDAKAAGKDGVIFHNFIDTASGNEPSSVAAVFDPQKIRSALPQSGSGEGTTSGGAFRSPESSLPSKTRVLDEMQSDWAQRARDHGTNDPARAAELQQTLNEKSAAEQAVLQEAKAFVKANVDDAPDGLGAAETLAAISNDHTDIGRNAKALHQRYMLAQNERLDAQSKASSAQKGVPSAPYISNTSDWVDLGLKSFLIDAARDPSVTRAAFTPGEQQVQRYPYLSKRVDGIRYNPTGHQLVYKPHGRDGWALYEKPGGGATIKPEELAAFVGDDVAKELLTGTGRARVEKLGDIDVREVGGLDNYEIGPARGMRKFYGEMTPEGYQSGIVGTRLQKLVKGLDPEAARVSPHSMPDRRSIVTQVDDALATHKVHGQQRRQMADHIADIVEREGPTALDDYAAPPGFEQAWNAGVAAAKKSGGTQYPSVPITPAMREKILKEGLPLFNIAALSALLSRILGQGQPDTEGEDGGGF